jgi:alkanesulfonate monooxygenase
LVIKQLLESRAPISYQGEFYRVDKLTLVPRLPQELLPEVFVSGSSSAGLAAACELGATAIEYPKPPGECDAKCGSDGINLGIRVGLITRETEDEAWQVAYEQFPCDRRGELAHQLATKASDSVWHKDLSERERPTGDTKSPYWLRPFETYKSFCPYLVGSYETVAGELSQYLAIGYNTFILDIPASEQDLQHISIALDHASRQSSVQLSSCG